MNDYKRKANWEKAKSENKEKQGEYVLVPVEYDSPHIIPGLFVRDDENEFKEKLAKLYFQPLSEYLVVCKEKGTKKAFLVQMSYDPFLMANKDRIDKSNLSGMLLRSSWDDEFLDGAYVNEGNIEWKFSNSKNARVSGCFTFQISYVSAVGPGSCNDPEYTAVYGVGGPCNSVNVIVVNRLITICTQDPDHLSNNPATNYYPSNMGGGGSSSGGSGGPIIRPMDLNRPYDLWRAVYEPGSADRIVFNQNIKEAYYATGLAVDILGWSMTKADALARSIGANMHSFTSLRQIVQIGGYARNIGTFGASISAVQFAIGYFEHEGVELTEDDYRNLLQTGLGIASVFAGPWWALGFGAATIIIALNNTP